MIPIPFRWTGAAMEPLSRFHNTVAAQFETGKLYVLSVVEDRSQKSHNHLFAEIAAVHESLPDELANNWPTPEHLRKAALIRAGFRTVRDYVCATAAEARRTAMLAEDMDEYAVVEISGTVVRVCRAQSMAWGRMKRADFQAAKDGVFRCIYDLTGIDPSGAEARAA